MRLRAEEKPKSLMARFWKWHTNWCPGWKAYITSLPDAERKRLAEKYNLKKYK